VTVYTVRDPDGRLLAVGALRTLGQGRAEIKSMHTAAEARGQGIGRRLLRHLVGEAQARQLQWIGLETGTMDEFAAARALYLSEGFTPCPPFASYTENPYSLCMARSLDP
jgi:putative acetyltransferase